MHFLLAACHKDTTFVTISLIASIEEHFDMKLYFCSNKVIPKELLAENLAYLSIVCSCP